MRQYRFALAEIHPVDWHQLVGATREELAGGEFLIALPPGTLQYMTFPEEYWEGASRLQRQVTDLLLPNGVECRVEEIVCLDGQQPGGAVVRALSLPPGDLCIWREAVNRDATWWDTYQRARGLSPAPAPLAPGGGPRVI